MAVAKLLRKLKFVPPERLLELYPPFFFMGVKVKGVDPRYRCMTIRLPLRWYGTNQYGSMFGGFVCSVSDPLPALLCSKIFPDYEIWTKKNCVEFLRPARSAIEAVIAVTDDDVAMIEKALDQSGRVNHEFTFEFLDLEGTVVARVHNTVYLKRGGRPFHR